MSVQGSLKYKNIKKINIKRNRAILITVLISLLIIISAVIFLILRPSHEPPQTPSQESDFSVLSEEGSSVSVTSIVSSLAEASSASSSPSASSAVSSSVSNTSSATSSPSKTKEESSAPVDESYYKDVCFIGDSRSEGFMAYAGPTGATYYVYKGLTVSGVSNTEFVKDGDKKVTVAEALKNHHFGKVYIMLGINELGWVYSSVFYDRYSQVIDLLKTTQPGAKIFVQSIFPVSATKSASDAHINNQRIKEYNTLIRKMCAQKELIYLDVGAALQDENGNLPEDAAYDGVHLKKPYCKKWRAYLDTHTNVPVATMPSEG